MLNKLNLFWCNFFSDLFLDGSSMPLKKKIDISAQQMFQTALLMSCCSGHCEYTTFHLSFCFLMLLVHRFPVGEFN